MRPKIARARLLICLPFFAVAGSACAQSLSTLDQLARETATLSGGIALARKQTADGNLLVALATLERVIMINPENAEARLLHASLLCRLDDSSGSLVEFEAMRGHSFAPSLWDEATAPCESSKTGH